ncbi:PorP/SprF family type IX secretion system membrane protein [Filimonas effusa]|uniref:Type IX secretion system membrane protein PorP/SprF n=1 Tax=Filimonas effusa TaxID=2508721 RepID=A0A4Q1D8P2_9BACT|nr:PorP/SprF family type IX secretion system membrane protein [Filimonas effusa]RXK85661.1 type IX secretion system membrane protein PorP/SprF [Filimonas effusa]
MRNYLNRILLVLGMAMGMGAVKAQDPNFSQYFSSPLTINPANTGFFYGNQRIVANYRRQWWGAGDPFTTATVSFDMKGDGFTGNEFDTWGLGVSALTDKSAAGMLVSNYAGLSFAYHKALDENGYSSLGLGFQASYVTRKVDLTHISFNSQFTSGGFDLNLPTGESYLAGTANHMDVSTGLLYKYDDETTAYYLGAGYMHVTQPKESILNSPDTKVPARLTLAGGVSLSVGYDSKLFLSGLYQNQANASTYAAGGAFQFGLPVQTADVCLYLGGWYSNASISPYLGMQYNTFQLGVTYDVVTSAIKTANPKNGSFELSLVYTFFQKDANEGKKIVPQF